jgi:hypothetical protein
VGGGRGGDGAALANHFATALHRVTLYSTRFQAFPDVLRTKVLLIKSKYFAKVFRLQSSLKWTVAQDFQSLFADQIAILDSHLCIIFECSSKKSQIL